MKKLISLAVLGLSLVGCNQPVFNAKNVPAPAPLTPPSTKEIRKEFSGKDWQLSLQDTGWRKGTSDGFALALVNEDTKTMVMLESKKDENDLATVAEEREAEFRHDAEWTKTEVIFAGYSGIQYSLTTPRVQIWAWLTVANGKRWLLTCGTPVDMAEANEEACEDVAKHLVIVKAPK